METLQTNLFPELFTENQHTFASVHHITQSHLSKTNGATSNYLLNKNDAFLKFITQDQFSMEWIDFESNQTLNETIAIKNTLLAICSGEGKFASGRDFVVKAGDLLMIPIGCQYHLKNESNSLLKIMRITFQMVDEPSGLDFQPAYSSLQELLTYNEARLKRHVEKPFFQLLTDGTLEEPKKRQMFLRCLYHWSQYFQRILFSRQATAVDKPFQKVFLEHLKEEFGHDELLATEQSVLPIRDSIFQATSSWFAYKMFTLDNVGKTAIIHLVLETSGEAFHTRAKHILSQSITTNYFHLHSEVDDDHAALGIELLKNQHPHIYSQLSELLEDAWNMFETMMDRISLLVREC
jgi:quercetin dioxygenase-like cupin family protein